MSTQVVHLAGELDAALVAARRPELIEKCERHSGSALVLDLTDVTFVDSTGLALLIGVARRMRDGGGEVRLRGCRRSVRRVLTLSGLNAVLVIDDPSDEPCRPPELPLTLPLAGGRR
jgi:anti-sigma B factor antagonist